MNQTVSPPSGPSNDAINSPFNQTNWTALSANFQHAVAIDSDGYPWTWGMNQSGQLGLDDQNSSKYTSPKRIGVVSKVTSVATGTRHTLLINGDGDIWGAGQNTFGALGGGEQGKSGPLYALQRIDLANTQGKWTAIYSKRDLSIGKLEDGSWWAWGKNDLGAVGCGTTDAIIDKPMRIFAASRNIVQVSAGVDMAAAIDSEGRLYVWGDNRENQITAITGVDTNGKPVNTPRQANFNQGKWLHVAVGATHGIAMDANRQVYAWGRGKVGQLGLGDDQTWVQGTPQKILQLPDASLIKSCIALEANALNSGIILEMSDGSRKLYVWGSNGYGEATASMQGNVLYATTPTIPSNASSLSKWFALQPGYFFSTALAPN
ncbi:hypothetical protein [Bordetella sp. LUAb4]|uniref:RCC1 domain-containing protein n=1 Tax=Bordetella sp. LUAb4 TaxID=2843195 RepID=UPI001E62241F|nr:hypothetical protein [Bordetella sp. LUAb4]